MPAPKTTLEGATEGQIRGEGRGVIPAHQWNGCSESNTLNFLLKLTLFGLKGLVKISLHWVIIPLIT